MGPGKCGLILGPAPGLWDAPVHSLHGDDPTPVPTAPLPRLRLLKRELPTKPQFPGLRWEQGDQRGRDDLLSPPLSPHLRNPFPASRRVNVSGILNDAMW